MTALVDMYAKCGNIEDAFGLFKRMNRRSIALWNAMLVGLAQHGNAEEALCLFKEMKSSGVMPDRVTFIGVLSACSHSGLVSEAYENFYSMQHDYGIEPEVEHYFYLVDALSRAGHIQEAEKVILSMPSEVSASMYRTLLNSCWVQGDKVTGERVAEKLFLLEPSDSAAYVLLSHIYAAANQWDNVTSARNMMKRTNVKKDPGFSWVDLRRSDLPALDLPYKLMRNICNSSNNYLPVKGPLPYNNLQIVVRRRLRICSLRLCNRDGHDTEDTRQGPADMTAFINCVLYLLGNVHNLLQQMQNRFQTTSYSIISKNILWLIIPIRALAFSFVSRNWKEGSPSPSVPRREKWPLKELNLKEEDN
ncbi:hypothetical protein K1719_005806 [Acacia pycnantha]|nr:hypothetical protein K1719_005806 [Acacia pycnantha]